MAIKKLFLNYKQFTSEIISKWEKKVDQIRSLGGDSYFVDKRDAYDQKQKHIWDIQVKRLTEQYSKDFLDKYGNSIIPPQPVVSSDLQRFKNAFEETNQNVNWLKTFILNNLSLSQREPVRLDDKKHIWDDTNILLDWYDYEWDFISKEGMDSLWLYQDAVYGIGGLYTQDEQKLLILEYADKERRKFENLKSKFSGKSSEELKYERNRIPEEVRVAVWRRDQGKCARCGNRENLEYDHIVPASKGGGNTARNIELLCQNCNRSKGNRIE